MERKDPKKVVAFKIDARSIYVKCPQRKICKMDFHTHGSDGDLTNRTEHRGNHCIQTKQNKSAYNNNLEIIINSSTKRNV